MPKNIEDIKPPKKEPSAFFLELSKAKAEAVGKKTTKATARVEVENETSFERSEPRPMAVTAPQEIDTRESRVYSREPEPVVTRSYRTPTSRRFLFRKRVWVSAIISVCALVAVLSIVFSGTKITVTPKVADFTVSSSYTASKDSVTNLSFQVMSLKDTNTVSVAKSGTATAPTKSTGTVVLYNAYSTSPQNLLINTRLTRPDGKIYFTDKALTIPGFTTKDTVVTPGSIEVTVTAENSGEAYDSEATDFKILGFKGSAKYDKIYGRSKTALTGGTNELQNTITLAEATTAFEQAKGGLRDKLLEKARAQIPADFILYDDGVFITTDTLAPKVSSKEEQIPVVASGTLTAIFFSKATLTKTIMEEHLKAPVNATDILITNLESLEFKIQNKQLIDPLTAKNITFSASGAPHALWQIDETKVKEALSGKPKSEVGTILESFPGILHARVTMRPFWATKLPTDPNEITLIIESDGIVPDKSVDSE